MIPAIGTPASSPAHATGGGVALQGQLARYEKELAACINCSTAETSEGKQKIQEVAGQIEQIKARIEQATQTRATLRAERGSLVGGGGLDSLAKAESAEVFDFTAQPRSRIGSLIDVVV